jgi:Flp pilus assembly protein TadG
MKFLRGQTSIALTLAIPLMVGAACIVAEMRAMYLSSVRLQRVADAAVLSGAIYLPKSPGRARTEARNTARMGGIRESEIIYDDAASDGKSITMVVAREVPYQFARIFGLSQSLITVKAVAGISSLSISGTLPVRGLYKAHSVARPALRCSPMRANVPSSAVQAIVVDEINISTPIKMA